MKFTLSSLCKPFSLLLSSIHVSTLQSSYYPLPHSLFLQSTKISFSPQPLAEQISDVISVTSMCANKSGRFELTMSPLLCKISFTILRKWIEPILFAMTKNEFDNTTNVGGECLTAWSHLIIPFRIQSIHDDDDYVSNNNNNESNSDIFHSRFITFQKSKQKRPIYWKIEDHDVATTNSTTEQDKLEFIIRSNHHQIGAKSYRFQSQFIISDLGPRCKKVMPQWSHISIYIWCSYPDVTVRDLECIVQKLLLLHNGNLQILFIEANCDDNSRFTSMEKIIPFLNDARIQYISQSNSEIHTHYGVTNLIHGMKSGHGKVQMLIDLHQAKLLSMTCSLFTDLIAHLYNKDIMRNDSSKWEGHFHYRFPTSIPDHFGLIFSKYNTTVTNMLKVPNRNLLFDDIIKLSLPSMSENKKML